MRLLLCFEDQSLKKYWRYKLTEDFCFEHDLLAGIRFENDWCFVDNRVLVIYAGYAWDGVSPRINVLDLFTLSAPEGRKEFGVPLLHDVTLVHDLLCQFRSDIPISKQRVVALFDAMLRDKGFIWRPLYTACVHVFGPQRFKKQD